MYIVIIGAGNLGYYLTHLLLEEEHECIIIEKDPKRCDKISHELDVVAINGDATDPKIMEKVDIKESDAVIALTGQDETNMVICLLAKDFGAKKVAARISRINYNEKILKKLGIEIIIHPEAAAAGYIAELITKPEIIDLAFFSRGDAEIIVIEIEKGGYLDEKKIGEIHLGEGASIIGYYEGESLVIAKPDLTLKPGTRVLVLSKRTSINRVRQTLNKKK